MHELGIVFHIIDTLEGVAKENNVTEIKSVTLEIGEVSTVIPNYLTDCWDWAVKRTDFMPNATLKVDTIKALTYCEDCSNTYDTVANGKICPHCNSENTYLVQGNEVSIKEIEAV